MIEFYLFLSLTIIVTILFGITFYKGLILLRKHGNHSSANESTAHLSQKEIQFMKIFILMYVIFLLPFVPKIVGTYKFINFVTNDLTVGITTLMLCTASICDPLMTLLIREDFKPDAMLKYC